MMGVDFGSENLNCKMGKHLDISSYLNKRMVDQSTITTATSTSFYQIIYRDLINFLNDF